jgi:hypothetical protein
MNFQAIDHKRAVHDASSQPKGPLRILLAEDSAVMQAIVVGLLGKKGISLPS